MGTSTGGALPSPTGPQAEMMGKRLDAAELGSEVLWGRLDPHVRGSPTPSYNISVVNIL